MEREREIKIKLTKGEFTDLLMGVIALKSDLEAHDKDKLSIPNLYIDTLVEKVEKLRWEDF